MSLGTAAFTYERPIEAPALRAAFARMNEGALDADQGALEVTAGAIGLSVDVAAGVGYVQGDTELDEGLYRAFNDAADSSTGWLAGIPAADPDDPRLDQVVLRIYNDTVDDSGTYAAVFEVIPGVPTAGATLGNRNGAAALPDSALPLADLLVPAAAASIAPGDIADRRVEAAPDVDQVAADLADHEAEGDTAHNLAAKQDLSEKGAANGYPSLDAGGKIPAAQLPAEAMSYKGGWNAATNTPALADGAGDLGDFYIVTTGASRDLGSGSIDFAAGDGLIYNGAEWEKIDHSPDGAISASLLDAKGDLIVATADDTPARLPVGATDGHVLTVDAAEAAGVKWSAGTPGPQGPVGLGERADAIATTAALADDASEELSISLAPGYRLLALETDAEARVQIYASAADRTADAARPVGTDPTGDHGVVLDFVTITGDLAWRLSPIVDGADMDASPDSVIPIRITNLSGGAAAIELTLTFQKIEAAAGAGLDGAIAGQAEDGLLVVRGVVDTSGAGTILEGAGFSITRNGAGDVTVTFDTAFSDVPAVTLASDRDAIKFSTLPAAGSFRVACSDEAAGALGAADGTFHFAAIGPA